MNFRKIIKTLTISVLFAVSATPVMGQDLLARQAPVDRKMKTVDTIMLRNIIVREKPNRRQENFTPPGTTSTHTAPLNSRRTSK